ncbi:MAG: hypothetical protein AAGF30_02590 [Pseudomonadota bacterium]
MGKTTLATALAQATGLPTIHLDTLFHTPPGSDRPRAQVLANLDHATAAPAWIAEGNHGASLDLCATRAAQIIILRIGPWCGLARLIRRRLTQGTPLPLHLVRYVLSAHPKIEPHHLARLNALVSEPIEKFLDNKTALDHFLAIHGTDHPTPPGR